MVTGVKEIIASITELPTYNMCHSVMLSFTMCKLETGYQRNISWLYAVIGQFSWVNHILDACAELYTDSSLDLCPRPPHPPFLSPGCVTQAVRFSVRCRHLAPESKHFSDRWPPPSISRRPSSIFPPIFCLVARRACFPAVCFRSGTCRLSPHSPAKTGPTASCRPNADIDCWH